MMTLSKLQLAALTISLGFAAPAQAVLIRSTVSPDNCLALSGPLYNGQSLSNVLCKYASDPTANFQGDWEIVRGNNPNGVRLRGTRFCLDATLPLRDDGAVTIWECLPGVAQQIWYYTDDDHIALTGQSSCVDFAGNGCGRFACSNGKRRCDTPTSPLGQRWTLENYPTTPPPTEPQPEYPPASGGRQLHPQGDVTRCIFVGNLKTAFPGVAGTVESCAYAGPNYNLQFFDLQRGAGALKLAGNLYNLCLDYGSNPTNGALAVFQTCNGGSSQNFYYTGPGDDHIAITGGTLCLDLRREDGKTLQYWQCGTNPQQVFTF